MDKNEPTQPTSNAADTRRDKRRRAILDAADALFFEKGYEATTLGEIVARSGGSLTTLYELFGNKTGLLSALVRERCLSITAVIDSVAIAELPPREALCTVARHLFTLLTDAGGIALFRVVIAESARQPELGRQFYEAGPASGRRIMAAFLAGQSAQGGLQVDDAEEAALHFFHMLLGDYQTRLLCGLPAAADAGEVERHIDRTIDAFLRLYARP
jgi:AcrR family transcriptional regulator